MSCFVPKLKERGDVDSNKDLQPRRKTECDLNDLLHHLDICEYEEQGIVLEEDLEELRAKVQWTALAKVRQGAEMQRSPWTEGEDGRDKGPNRLATNMQVPAPSAPPHADPPA